MSKLAGVYEWNGVLFISSYHRTKSGYWIIDPEITVVQKGATSDIERAVVQSLERSQSDVADLPLDASPLAHLLRTAGAKSWYQFARRAKSVAIELDDEGIHITPERNLGGQKGFVPLVQKAIVMPEGQTGLGAATVEALSMTE